MRTVKVSLPMVISSTFISLLSLFTCHIKMEVHISVMLMLFHCFYFFQDVHGIQVCFKGGRTIKNLLVFPKDRDTITQKSEEIYRQKYARIECDEGYIAESAETFPDSFKKHLKTPPLFMAIITPQVIPQLLTTSA